MSFATSRDRSSYKELCEQINIFMRQKDIDTIHALVKSNMRTSIGRISQKELRPNHFVSGLFEAFDLTNKKAPSASVATNRARVQELVSSNSTQYMGRCRYPNFSVDDFINDLELNFALQPKRGKSRTKATKNRKAPMKSVKAASLILMFVAMFSACSDVPQVTPESQRAELEDQTNVLIRDNQTIQYNLPVLQRSSDTLMHFLQETQDTYTRNILIKNINELNSCIEKNKETFVANTFKIQQNTRSIARLMSKDERVLLDDDTASQHIIGTDTLKRVDIHPFPQTSPQ